MKTEHTTVKLLGLLSLMFFFTQCYEPTEGCRDPFSTNYDVTADNPCEDCCTDPELMINLRLKFDTLDFSIGSPYPDMMNDTVVFTELELALSQFRLYDSIGSEIDKLDSVETGSTTITDDFIFVNSVSRTQHAFDFQYIGDLTQLDFSAGVPESINGTDINFESSAQATIRDSLFDESLNQYLKLKMSWFLEDSILRTAKVYDMDDEILDFALDTNTVQASNITLTLNLDVQQLMSSISFAVDDTADIEDILEVNLPNSFMIE